MRPGSAAASGSRRASTTEADMEAEGTAGRPATAGIRRLWIFDFDGTLAPLVPDRDAARLHPSCLDLLKDLAALRDQRTAILSSRRLEDLAPRVPVPGLLLGGASGLAWQIPDGRRDLPPREVWSRLQAARARFLPRLDRIAHLPGIDLEDKQWSMSIHFRHASPEARKLVAAWAEAESTAGGAHLFRGPEVFELQFLPEVDKALGVQNLCRLLGADPDQVDLVYAGDDTNDLAAMRWVLARGGSAFFVGGACPITGPLPVGDPAALAEAVRGLLAEPGRGAGRKP